VLLATFIGGVTFFIGPIVGALVFTIFTVLLSDFTRAWQLYLGVFFVALVMLAPNGLAGLVLVNLRVLRAHCFSRLRGPYLGVIGAGLVLSVGAVMMVEMAYHLSLNFAKGPEIALFGLPVDATRVENWILAATLVGAGTAAELHMWRRFRYTWNEIQGRLARGEGP